MELFKPEPSEDAIKQLGQWAYELPEHLVGKALSLGGRAYLTGNDKVYPEKEDLFKLFRTVSPDDVKVVIVGQDPYHDGNATGIAFACKIKPSPSLISIIKAIIKDVGTLEQKFDPELKQLPEQGVFLLNTVLTVFQGKPNSHIALGWQEFTKGVIKHLNDTKKNIVFLLWGNNAITNFKLLIDKQKHLEMDCEHPVAAAYNKKDWVCNHFSRTNDYLRSIGKEPIKWI